MYYQVLVEEAVPDLVKKEKLLKANTLIQSSSSLASIIGVLVAGGIVLISDPAYGFILHSFCLIISSVFIGFTRPVISYQEVKSSKQVKEVVPLLNQMAKSIRELFKF